MFAQRKSLDNSEKSLSQFIPLSGSYTNLYIASQFALR